MTLFAQTNGQRVLKPKLLTTTGATTICTAAEKRTLTLESLLISVGATPSALAVWITDGTTDYPIINGPTLAATTTTTITDQHIPLADGWSLKAQAGVANTISILATVIQSNSQGRG